MTKKIKKTTILQQQSEKDYIIITSFSQYLNEQFDIIKLIKCFEFKNYKFV